MNLKRLALLLLILFVVNSSFPFERLVWVYWDKPMQQAPLLVQLCYQKIKQTCIKQNWQLTLLSQQNVINFIPNYQQSYQKVVKNAKSPFKQAVADLTRFSILHQHGGIWLDITSILFNGLNWIQQLDKHPYFITNQQTKQPDLIAFYISMFQSRTQWRDQIGALTNFNPGYQMWFLASRKNGKIISEWRKQFVFFYQRTFYQNHQIFQSQDIFFRHLEQDDYLIGNKAIYYLLQKKQLQLDKSLSIFSQRHNVNKYYRIWGLHGQYGPLSYALKLIPDQYSLMQKTIKQAQALGQMHFFLKITQGLRPTFQTQLTNQLQISSSHSSFKQFIKANPTPQQCNKIHFILGGSILGYLIEDNPIALKYGLFTITEGEQEIWYLYCKDIRTFRLTTAVDYVKAYAINIFLGSLAKADYLRFYLNPSLSFLQYIQLIISVNRLFITLFIIIGFATILIGIIINLMVSIIVSLVISNRKLAINRQVIHNRQVNPKRQLKKVQTNSPKQNLLISLYILTTISTIVLFLSMDEYGGINQQHILLLMMLWSIIIDIKIVPLIRQSNLLLYITVKDLIQIANPISNYIMGKLLINSILSRQNQRVPYSVIVFLIVPLALKIGKGLNINQINRLFKILIKYQWLNRLLAIGLLVLITLLPNLKFMVSNQANKYVIRNLIYLPLGYATLVYLAYAFQVLKIIINWDKKSQKFRNQLKHLIKFCLLIVVTWNCCWLKNNFSAFLSPQSRILVEVTIIFFFINMSLSESLEMIQGDQFYKQFCMVYGMPLIYVCLMCKYSSYNLIVNPLIELPILFICCILVIYYKNLQQKQISHKVEASSFSQSEYKMVDRQQLETQ